MSKIRSKDTKPKIEVRKLLHSMDYRFRVNKKTSRETGYLAQKT
jgi:G:T-mismatch repair DNA endonuclease (very short patch repair protein)